MDKAPHFYVERFNSYTNKYELQHPIVWNADHTEQVVANLFPYNDCDDLFTIIEGNSNSFPPMSGIHDGLPYLVCSEIKEAYTNDTYDIEFMGHISSHAPVAHWFSYADMYIYCLENPNILNHDMMENQEINEKDSPSIAEPNPLYFLINRVNAFLEVSEMNEKEYWQDDFSQIRIVYWIN